MFKKNMMCIVIMIFLTILITDNSELSATIIKKKIIIDLERQKLYAYENEILKFKMNCVTGDRNHPTKSGTFKIFRKEKEYRSKKYNVDMPFTMFFSIDGKGIHAGLCCFDIESFIKAVADKLGKSWLGSHGCVRLDKADAEKLFDWAEIGTPVEIVESMTKDVS